MHACGLDFGTTNSTFSYPKQGSIELVNLEGQQQTLPSAVFYNFDDGDIYYGRAALNEYADGEFGRLMRSLKSVLGTKLMDDTTQIKGKSVSFVEIIAGFLTEMKNRAEKQSGLSFEQVVMGRPVYFVDDNKTADQKAQNALESAAKMAGFKDIEFQYEPIAAALDYEQSVTGEELAIIVDLGGGTSDFSVVRVSQTGAQKVDRKDDILSTGGVHIGGVDFDRRLSLKSVMPHLGYRTPFKGGTGQEMPVYFHQNLATWHKIHFLYDKETLISLRSMLNQMEHKHLLERLLHVIENKDGHRIAMHVEAAKIGLSNADVQKLLLDCVEDNLAVDVTKDDFNQAILEDVQRVCQSADHTLGDAGVKHSDITKIFMTGGSTSIPYVRQAIMSMFPQADVVDGHTFGSVGTGLSLHAGRVFK